MVDTVRTLAALQTLLADNSAGDISAQDIRDFLVSAYPFALQKKLTGTTGATEGDTTNIAHGFGDISKILGYHVLVSTSSGNRVPPAFTSVAEHEYDAFMDGTNVVVALTAANSGSLLSRAISVLVTYEE